MNYLAHAYLSFRDPELLLGNMISDHVKGKKKLDYPWRVQQGIALHRAIDQFTDEHASTQWIKDLLRPYYRLYGGAFADVIYDHFLATDSSLFPDNELYSFSQWVYATLTPQSVLFPETFQRMFPYMVRDNWLYHYKDLEGMEKSFGGLVRRARYLTDSKTAFELLQKNYQPFRECYQRFFPELLVYINSYYQNTILPFSSSGS